MYLFLTHKLNFSAPVSKKQFLSVLENHQKNCQRNWANRTIQDYAIITDKHKNVTIIRSQFARSEYVLEVNVVNKIDGILAEVLIKPDRLNIILTLFIALLISITPLSLTTKLLFLLALYLFKLISLGFTTWWTRDLFDKKLLP